MAVRNHDDVQRRKMSRVRAGLVAALSLSVTAAALMPVIAPTPLLAQAFNFSNVTIQGNQRIEPETILSHAAIRRGQPLSAAELNDAWQRLSNTGLFERVSLTPRGNTLVIEVKEYPIIGKVAFEGNARLSNEIIAKLVESKERRVYSPAQAEADAERIAEGYSVQGRMAARVEPRIIPRADNRVDLVFEIVEGKVVEIERLTFVGNRAYSDRRLRQVLDSKQAGLLRAIITRDSYVGDRIELDKQMLKDFYLSRGYIDFQVLDATAELARERDGFFVTFSIQEGQQYDFGKARVVSEIAGVNAADYQPLVRIKAGDVYNPSDIEAAIARMESRALRDGVNFLRVEPRTKRDDRGRIIDIDFALVRGERVFVERIDIEGNTTTMDEVIRRQFRAAEGDPLSPGEIREAAERIRALGFFEDAEVEAVPGSSEESVIVKATVTEQPTGSLSLGASYGKADGVGFMIGMSESNFLGRGQQFGIDIALGADDSVSSLTFAEPALLGRDLRFSFNLMHSTSEANYATWNQRVSEMGMGLEFPLSDSTRMQARYTLGVGRVTNVEYNKDWPAVENRSSSILGAERDRGSLTSSGVGYTFSWDNRRNGMGNQTAWIARFGQDLYGLGGDMKYLQTEAFLGMETSILHGDVKVRAELEGGALNASGNDGTRVVERYFLAGKIRGFEPFGIGPRDLSVANQDPLGGNYFWAARIEADFPIGLPEEYGLRGGVFLDAGSVWNLEKTVSTTGVVDDGMKLRAAAGVSLLWDTPVGPLRFNFSRALKKESYDKEQTFDLTISTKF